MATNKCFACFHLDIAAEFVCTASQFFFGNHISTVGVEEEVVSAGILPEPQNAFIGQEIRFLLFGHRNDTHAGFAKPIF